jgi:hypothetical protein
VGKKYEETVNNKMKGNEDIEETEKQEEIEGNE